MLDELGVADVASQGLMSQVGGMDSISSLAGLVQGADVDSMQGKLSDQLCSMLGGGCKAPLSEDQIARGAQKLTPSQATAVKDNLGSALGDLDLSSSLQGAVSKAIAPKLPGIIGALL